MNRRFIFLGIMYKNIEIIAEVKIKSPFGYEAQKSWEEFFDVACEIGDIVAIHTDPRWGGSFELLARACKLTNKPVLAKGIHPVDDDIKKAINCGAQWVLVVGRIPKVFPEHCIIEPLEKDELSKISLEFRVLWNARNLNTGDRKKESFAEIRKLRKGWLCQASFIKTVNDIDPEANAVLVGTDLVSFRDSLKRR